MTDAELDRLTERLIAGDPTAEAEYERLTAAAIANGEALLADPARMAEAARTAFVPAPVRGERMFRAYCVRRGNAFVGQFDSKADARAAMDYARATVPGYLGGRIRSLKNFVPTLGHVVHELKVNTKS